MKVLDTKGSRSRGDSCEVGIMDEGVNPNGKLRHYLVQTSNQKKHFFQRSPEINKTAKFDTESPPP